ncbi:interleukin-27 subunit beta [Latimeria chalumnae]|nr:PREDICTED: interleukin-27 subunit beta [Latimeria chalumnae]|eukprot:XP_005999129.1 PREDICTED: interleukin-27 subunit beta [Latimeria chalumnae]
MPSKETTVEWKVNGKAVALAKEVIARDTFISILNANRSQEGQYSCHNARSGETLNTVQLKLGNPPRNLSVSCWSVSYPMTVQCFWSLGTETFLPVNYNATYSLGIMDKEQKECVQLKPEENSCTISNILMFSEISYVVKVTATNPLGSSAHMNRFIVEEIIKPDPPENLIASPIPGQRRKLFLEWKPPSTWPEPEYFPLTYLIQYQKVGTQASRVIGPYEQTNFTLSGLRPRAQYSIQVSAKDFTDHGHYSDWSSVVSAKPWTNS